MKVIHTSGKRKRAVARATVKKGSGRVFVNKLSLDNFGTPMTRQRILEPLLLAGKLASGLDVDVSVVGGGVSGQSGAIRLAIGRALVEHTPALKNVYLDYDRALLVADVRYKESAKPNSHGKARSKRQKSYR